MYYPSAGKRRDFGCTPRLTDLKDIRLSEKSWPQKVEFCKILFIYHSWHEKIGEMEIILVLSRGVRGGGESCLNNECLWNRWNLGVENCISVWSRCGSVLELARCYFWGNLGEYSRGCPCMFSCHHREIHRYTKINTFFKNRMMPISQKDTLQWCDQV